MNPNGQPHAINLEIDQTPTISFEILDFIFLIMIWTSL
jgi:hypothetical protein